MTGPSLVFVYSSGMLRKNRESLILWNNRLMTRILPGPSKVFVLETSLENLGHTAAFNAPEMPAHPSWLVLAQTGVDDLFEQRAIGTLSLAITLDHVGVE